MLGLSTWVAGSVYISTRLATEINCRGLCRAFPYRPEDAYCLAAPTFCRAPAALYRRPGAIGRNGRLTTQLHVYSIDRPRIVLPLVMSDDAASHHCAGLFLICGSQCVMPAVTYCATYGNRPSLALLTYLTVRGNIYIYIIYRYMIIYRRYRSILRM